MKRILLSSLLACFAYSAYAAEMPEEQLLALEEKAMELYPDSIKKQDNWLSLQKSAYDYIQHMDYDISPADFAIIKTYAEKRFENSYKEQEVFIRTKVDSLMTMSAITNGIDADEINRIKSLAAEEANGNADIYIDFFEEHLSAKKLLETMKTPRGISEIDFLLLKRITDKYYQGNYRKQYNEINKNVDLIISVSNAENAIDKKDPNAFNTVGQNVIAKNTLKTSDEDPKLAIAIKFRDRLGFICPLSSYSEDFELLTAVGDRVKIEAIHISKEEAVIFVETLRFPEGIEPLELDKIDEVKTKLSKPLVFAGYNNTSKASVAKTALSAVRDTFYLLDTKISPTFTDGTMVLDYDEVKLITFALKGTSIVKTIPDFNDRSKALSMLRKSNATVSKSNISVSYPILEKLGDFEILDQDKMAMQREFLDTLIADNIEALKLYEASSLSSLSTSLKFGEIAREYSPKFRVKLGDEGFNLEAMALMNLLIAELENGFDSTINPEEYYINIRNEMTYQLKLRKALIDYYKKQLKVNPEAILPRDILSAKGDATVLRQGTGTPHRTQTIPLTNTNQKDRAKGKSSSKSSSKKSSSGTSAGLGGSVLNPL